MANRLVRTNYAVRTAAFLYCLITIGLHLWQREAAPLAWILLVLQFAVYPHLVYLRATHSTNPRRAELDNLLIDSTLLGAWVGALGLPTWIAFGLTGATMLNAALNRGTVGALASLACTGVGAALALAVTGLVYSPGTTSIVTVLCFAGSLWYMTLVGTVLYTHQKKLVSAREALRAGEERYRFIAENAADLISLVDADARWLYASPSYQRILD